MAAFVKNCPQIIMRFLAGSLKAGWDRLNYLTFNKPQMANEPTISEMNKVIALFDGGIWKEDDYGDFGFFFPDNSKRRPTAIEALKYHTSWDWLMPVIEKIASIDYEKYNFHISSTGQWACYINRDDVFDSEIASYGGFEPMIINVHKAVYKFIQWYNQNTNDTRKQDANS